MIRLPRVAIIGRTNVGKSTLLNRVLEERQALVSSEPGTTRDRKAVVALWQGRMFHLIDTGGFEHTKENPFQSEIAMQTEKAIEEAEVLWLVLDAKTGPLPQELALARRLMKQKKSVLVLVNKVESPRLLREMSDKKWRLAGLPAPHAISALRGMGIGDVLDATFEAFDRLKLQAPPWKEPSTIRVALVGKPNVGKSSLFNALLDEQRAIVSSLPHTTREPQDVDITHRGVTYTFIDTAGLRRRAKARAHGDLLEELGVEKTLASVKRADVALFVLDGSEPFTTQDRVLAGMLANAQIGVVFVINKWDAVSSKQPDTIYRFQEILEAWIPFVRWAPMLFVSAKNGQRVKTIFDAIQKVHASRLTRLTPQELDAFLDRVMSEHLPSRGKGPRPPKILRLRQTDISPPTFLVTLSGKRADVLHPSYLRFLENRLRDRYPFTGSAIAIHARPARSDGR